jgi:hypothetical protein
VNVPLTTEVDRDRWLKRFMVANGPDEKSRTWVGLWHPRSSEEGRSSTRSGCRSPAVEAAPAPVTSGVYACWDRLRCEGFHHMTRVVPVKRNTRGGTEGSRHWIARRGYLPPGGYRSPIRLVGGARLRLSDPRDGCPSGTRGYSTPILRSVDDDETQPSGPGAAAPGPDA